MKGKLRYMSLKFEPPKNNIIFTPSDRIKKAKRKPLKSRKKNMMS